MFYAPAPSLPDRAHQGWTVSYAGRHPYSNGLYKRFWIWYVFSGCGA